MKSLSFCWKLISILELCLVVIGCTKDSEPVPVESLTLSPSSITISVGESHTLVATISPSDADNQKVLWSSTDPSVASVNEGVVTAVKDGFTMVTAKSEDKGKTAMCMVTVLPKIYLSSEGTANCYIVSRAGAYEFTPVKGNSKESVVEIASADVLWETFGTDVEPAVGDLVTNVKYNEGAIYFETSRVFKEGNAVIAARNAKGEILWSWHIWMTDMPQEQVYHNGAGIFMDRNLGATTSTRGEAGSLGLYYQWGRKDPFLNASSISDNDEAKSTIKWPSAELSDMTIGTMEYAIANPTTFIKGNQKTSELGWFFKDYSESSVSEKFWAESSTPKGLYDPCPLGWRIPSKKLWDKVMDPSYTYDGVTDKSCCGVDFSGFWGADPEIWYPLTGWRSAFVNRIADVGSVGFYWSASANGPEGFVLNLYFKQIKRQPKAMGFSVRCVKE